MVDVDAAYEPNENGEMERRGGGGSVWKREIRRSANWNKTIVSSQGKS